MSNTSNLQGGLPQRKTQLDGLAVVLLLACCLFWGLQQVLVKASLHELPAVFQATARSAGATVLLMLWCRWRGVPLFQRDGSWAAGLLAGTLFALEFGCIYYGIQFTSASRLTVLLYTSPLWVAALLSLWGGSERLRGVQWLGLLAAFASVLWAVREGVAHSSGHYSWQGDVLGLLAGLFWALTTVTIRTTGLTRISPEKLLFYQIGITSVLLAFVSVALGEQWPTQVSGFAALSLALQTVVGAFISYLVWMWMLGRYPATRLSVFVFLTPIFALLFGHAWLNEPITPGLVAALIGVAVGIVLVNRR